MAGKTVIDELIVKLGLDPRDFTKGTKEAAAAVVQTEQTVKKSGDGMSRQLTGLAAKWLSVAGAVMAVKKAVTIIDDVATKTRRLGIDAKNYGVLAAGLRNFENTVEMFGGSAEDARKSINGLNKAVFDLAYNGQMSDGLVMLARLGVEFQTATGEARDFKSIVLDTADAIGEAQANGMSRSNAFQYLQQSGFDSGTSQMILAGRTQAEAAMAAQEQRRQVSDQDVTKATGIEQQRLGRDQALAGAAVGAMEFAGGVQEGFNKLIEKLASPGGVNAVLGDLAGKAKGLGDAFDAWSIKVAGTTRGLRNNNPGNIRGVEGQNRDRQGFRIFSTMEEGVKEADEQLDRYAKRGKNTIRDIISTWAPPSENDTEKYIKDVVDDMGVSSDTPLGRGDRPMLLAAMFKKESGVGAPDSGAIADILQGVSDVGPTPLASGGASPSPAAQASTTYSKTDVHIDSITIQTQAKDAEAVADGMDAAVKRKLLASHAEQGMQ